MALRQALETAKKCGDRIVLDRGKYVPVKSCVVCHRDFTWRKKWERCWDEVTTCSKTCNGARKQAAKQEKKVDTRDSSDCEVETGQKNCHLCSRSVNLLIRCSLTPKTHWVMVCGKCWHLPSVANGVVDGDATNPDYRYGGLWKNRRA
jgi:hypothetical protein